MKRICRRTQRALGDHGSAAVRHDEVAQKHLEECGDCFALLESLAELDAALDTLPELDAPDGLVDELVARVELGEADGSPVVETIPSRRWGFLPPFFDANRWRLQASLAAALLAVVSLSIWLRMPASRAPEFAAVNVVRAELPSPLDAGSASMRLNRQARVAGPSGVEVPKEVLEQLSALGYVGGGGSESEASGKLAGWAGQDKAGEVLPVWVGSEAKITFRDEYTARVDSGVTPPFDDDDADARAVVRERLRERLGKLPRGLEVEEVEVDSKKGDSGAFSAEYGVSIEPSKEDLALDPARRFLAERDALDASFQPAAGYWSNTYVPGDPVLRYLQARLSARDRSLLLAGGGDLLRLHDAARRAAQPFDPPTEAAMAITVHSDRAALAGESRLLVQVGLVGADRLGGRRPAMNVAVVLDLTGGTTVETARSSSALMASFAAAREVGDRFRLIVAGPRGGEILGPESFRHGPVTVAMRQLLPVPGADASGEPLDLAAALRIAIERVSEGDDPTAPLGASTIVLVTPRPLEAELQTLAELAHRSAVGGIPVSVVGIGDGVDLGELERLALSGQGHRRLLSEPAEASALVGRELAAAARVVARAVRLRIALAPGVRLVEVIGARRFDEAAADKVRQAERSIDQRLARNLGIEADRGDDEPGIQIVIPSFYAGDRHVVLLDVVAPGPGAVAEVTARFKDLVRLGNGIVRAQLDLARGERERGPLERNVLKNLLAQRLRGAFESASQSVTGENLQAAAERLREHRELLAGLGVEVPGFDRDPDLKHDVAMLDEYVQLLLSGTITDPEQRVYLAESLRYAARLKVLPPPLRVGAS